MKKIVFIIIIILNFVALFSPKLQNSMMAQSNLTLSEAKGIASTYYGSLQEMAKNPVEEIAKQNEIRLYNALGVDVNGNSISLDFRVPNDLVKAVEDPLAEKETVLITNYVGSFLRIAENKKMDYSYKVLSNEYLYGPEIRKSEALPLFVRVVVEKTIKSPSFSTIQIKDTMYIDSKSNSVALITNEYRKSGLNGENMSINELLAEAQNMYSNKRYDMAFKLYQKVLEKEPMNSKASYDLGVMCFKGEGCKQYPRKVRDYLVEFYWQKSESGIRELMFNKGSRYVVMSSLSGMESDPFPSNRLLTHKNGKVGYISPTGKMVIKQQYSYGYPFFTNGTTLVKTDKDEWLLIDTLGSVKEVYTYVREVTGNKQLIVTQTDKEGVVKKEGVINRMTGEWDIPPISRVFNWYAILDVTMCYFAIRDGKCGVLSPNNKVLVPFDYYNMVFVSCDLNWVKLLCDYDETKYNQLWKTYKDSSKIPEAELNSIGTLIKISF